MPIIRSLGCRVGKINFKESLISTKLKDMTIIEKPGNLKKIQIAFWINLPITVVSVLIFIKSVDSMVLWKIIASGIGCLVFLL
jgi:hypothetical protein